MTVATQEKTGLGNYFVANYPPFSAWKAEHVAAGKAVLDRPPNPQTPLGLYLHIPFCRKRCKFCYFRVYTDKNSDDVRTYTDALLKEVELYSRSACVGDRHLQFVYFGGGTPSYLSASQLRELIERLHKLMPWDSAREVTFECEPGTLQQHKLQTLKELGISRLSLGIENFGDAILESNGRAHLSAEIYRCWDWIIGCDFATVNIDLIAGMVGETWDNWIDSVQKTIELSPDSVTIYQMELPYNTVFSKELHVIGQDEPKAAIADWPTKRAWVQFAWNELAKVGYLQSSAYTMVKPKGGAKSEFVYRDSLWHGADMFGTGVASFGHVGGVHLQNVDRWEDYVGALLQRGELPLGRALPVTDRQRFIRELILQLKAGRIEASYFRDKFDIDPLVEFAGVFEELNQDDILAVGNDGVDVTADGLMQIDRNLPKFFEPQFRDVRYT